MALSLYSWDQRTSWLHTFETGNTFYTCVKDIYYCFKLGDFLGNFDYECTYTYIHTKDSYTDMEPFFLNSSNFCVFFLGKTADIAMNVGLNKH